MQDPQNPATGKLATLGETSQSYEGDDNKAQSCITISLTSSPAATYKLHCEVNGVSAPFIIDTGAAVSLLRKDVRERCGQDPGRLQPWAGQRLVGVDGAPLSVLGCTRIAIVVSGQVFHPQMLVVDTLTSEGILGMDFLRENRCSMDISEGVLHFKDRGVTISVGDSTDDRMAVHLVSQLEIPARSEVEVPATVDESVNGKTWLLEGKQIKQCPLIFARAIVSPTNGEVVVQCCLISLLIQKRPWGAPTSCSIPSTLQKRSLSDSLSDASPPVRKKRSDASYRTCCRRM